MADDGIRPGLRTFYATQEADAKLRAMKGAEETQSKLMAAAPELAKLIQSGDPESMRQAAATLTAIKPELAADPAFKSLADRFQLATVTDETGRLKAGAFNTATGEIKDTGFGGTIKQSGQPYSYQKVLDENGEAQTAVVDNSTGKIVSFLGKTAFAQQFRINPSTGEIVGLNPGNTSQAAKPIAGTGATPLPTTSSGGIVSEPTSRQLFESLQPKQKESYKKLRDDFYKDTEAERSAITSAQAAISKLQAGEEIGGDILRAIQNEFARSNGEKGVMTDKDVDPFGGRPSVAARLQRLAEYNSTGKMPKEDRVFMQEYAAAMARASQAKLDSKAIPFAEQIATQTPLTSDQAKSLISQGLDFTNRPQTADEALIKMKGLSPQQKQVLYKSLPANIQEQIKTKLAKKKK